MDGDKTEGSQATPYFAGRAEHLIGQVVGTLDASAGHPGASGGADAEARIAALEDRLADAERRLATLEGAAALPSRPPGS